jgi:hypothetical protein
LGAGGRRFESFHTDQWKVPLNGRQSGLNPEACASMGVRFVYLPPFAGMVFNGNITGFHPVVLGSNPGVRSKNNGSMV